MDTTTTTTNRTGAVWVAGTGAFLLLAATALFVAVRWDDIPGAAKLGIVGALTGAFLLGGRALARTLPATGDVIFHLGALLIPVDVAAVSVRLGLGWRGLLLAEGLAAGGALAALAAGTGSVVLTGVAGAGAVVAAGGVAGVSPVPAPLLLASAAVAAMAAATIARRPAAASPGEAAAGFGSGGREVETPAAREGAGAPGGREQRGNGVVAARLALMWATVAGLAPVIGTVAVALLHSGGRAGAGVLTELGLAGHTAGWAALASGALAAGVLGREAKARADAGLAALALAVLVAGFGPAGVAADLTRRSALLALPGLFVTVEAAAVLARRDEFWARIVAGAAVLAEVPAAVIGWPVAVFWTLVCPITNDLELFGERFRPDPALGVSLGLLALGWFLRGARGGFALDPTGRPSGWSAALLGPARDAAGAFAWLLAPAVVAAVAVGTASGPVTAGTVVVLGAVLATASGRGARLAAGALALWAPISTVQRPWAALAAGVAGAAVATVAARRATRPTLNGASAPGATAEAEAGGGAGSGSHGRAHPSAGGSPILDWLTTGPTWPGVEAVVLTVAAVGAALLGWVTGPAGDGIIAGSLLAVAACTAVAAALEPAPGLPMLARVGGVVAAFAMAAADPDRALPALLLATVLAAGDAVARNRPAIGFGAAATVQLVVVDLAHRGGLDAPGTGLALCVAAVVWAGLALLADGRWHPPLLTAAAVGLVTGLALASRDPRSQADALLIVGGLVAAAGLVTRRAAVVGAGAVIVSLAVGSHLELSHVRATDAYLAPVAALLLGAGFHLRRTGDGTGGDAPSSWVAYTPAVVLLGGAALAERIAGGGGVHALVAGAVGIAAVAAGGGRRLAGPLVTGTALLVAVTVHESLGTLATVPTWGWLAAGGSLLLALGVTLERRGGDGPVEAGRRLVDVVAERFS
ncbi:MAG TPA: hypothetical protein VK848_07675 [Acidimicrobiia bacterium]|nr:hypothetical protein [Acidimicrobiia bacterium]